jgi:PIN domain nuclease of toxin-antitoxin system
LQRPVLYRAGALPPVHKDPFDRVIAADALHRDLRVVSPDAPFELYGCTIIW